MALVLVTGASTGLGAATAAALIDDGHDVVVHARAEERVEDRQLLERARGAVFADLAYPDAVGRLGEELAAHGPFDAVVHNAGVIGGPDVGAVNVVAPYLLATTMPRPARTIVLSSSMHLSGDERIARAALDDPLSARWSYQDSKLAVTALTLALADRWSEAMVHAVDPGWVPTRMGGAGATDDLVEGHRTQAWLAIAPEAEVQPATGGYWHHHAVRRPHPAALDPDFQQQVLDALARTTGLDLPT